MSSVAMLPEGQKNDVQVTPEDQDRINSFSKLILRQDKHKAVLGSLQEEKEYIDELSLELELMDEDEKLSYNLGDCSFIKLKVSKIIKLLETDLEELNKKEEDISTEIDEIEVILQDLKQKLYAKFGNNINMER